MIEPTPLGILLGRATACKYRKQEQYDDYNRLFTTLHTAYIKMDTNMIEAPEGTFQ